MRENEARAKISTLKVVLILFLQTTVYEKKMRKETAEKCVKRHRCLR